MDLLAKRCVNYCRANGIENPVEILSYAQSLIVSGKPLDVQNAFENEEGETKFILINRQDVLKSAIDEIQFLKDARLTLAVGFYGVFADVQLVMRLEEQQHCQIAIFKWRWPFWVNTIEFQIIGILV